MKNALLIFAKAPVTGHVKTRLAATVGKKAATLIYEKLLWRNLELARQSRAGDKVLCAFSSQDAEYFKARLDWPVRVQADGNIGERMRDAMATSLLTYDAVVLIGVDIVDAKAQDLIDAFESLDRGMDMVLGPSYDGGYWLIGSRGTRELPFERIDWSTPRVFSQTRGRMKELGVNYSCLPVRHDIDVEKDLVFSVEP